MNPQDHTARITSPFIERAESADVVDYTDTDSVEVVDPIPALPVHAGDAVGFGDVPRLLPRRHMAVRRSPVRGVALGVAAAVLAEVGLVMGLLAGLEAIGGGR